MNTSQTLFIWPLYIRLLHWTLAASFVVSYASGELGLETLHEYAGYVAFLATFTRIFLGFLPLEFVSFRDMLFSPSEIFQYALMFVRGKISLHQGHNPLGSLMVFALLVSILLSAISGLISYASIEYSGIFYEILPEIPHPLGDLAEEIHEVMSKISLILVLMHILIGVVLGSILLQKNIAKAMLK